MTADGLNRDELAILEAALDRLIPSDEHGPGAREAKVSRYVARRLAGPDRHRRDTYAAGLARLDADAAARYGAGFAHLPAAGRDELLRAAEARPDDPFFETLLGHATEGMFGDPIHGGNANRAGWELLGYPGPRPVWTESDQRLGRTDR